MIVSPWLNFFPDEDNPVKIFKLLVRPMLLFAGVICCLGIALVLIGMPSVDADGEVLSKLEGVIACLLSSPFAFVGSLLAGTFALAVVRRLPLVGRCYPRWQTPGHIVRRRQSRRKRGDAHRPNLIKARLSPPRAPSSQRYRNPESRIGLPELSPMCPRFHLNSGGFSRNYGRNILHS